MVGLEALVHASCADRDKFISRLFGIFNETIVRIWCRQPQAAFEDLGRPTLKKQNGGKALTLDFTLRSSKDNRLFIAEMKCDLEYENYRYLRLTSAQQLDHHTKPAFRWFLSFAKNPSLFSVKCDKKVIAPQGAILVWGCLTEQGRQA